MPAGRVCQIRLLMTFTGKEQLDLFPQPSVAVQVTMVVVPALKRLPEGGTQAIVTVEQSSLAVAL